MALLSFSRAPHRRSLAGPGAGAHRHARDMLRERSVWASLWRDAAVGCGLHRSVTVAAGITDVTPKLVTVETTPAGVVALVVEVLAGQLAEDYRAVVDRLALALGCVTVAVVPRDGRHLALELHRSDPLADAWMPTLAPVASVHDPLTLFRGADGTAVTHALAAPMHLAVQGQNGSGKSAWTYAVLGQLAAAPDVVIGGSDITGLVLGRPWDGTRHREHQAAGTADLDGHARILEAHVAEMDRRLADMPPRCDKLTPSPDLPLRLVVIEETPGLLRAAESLPKPKRGDGPSVGDRIRTALLRLLSEGRKVAFRVLMLAQRFEAAAVGGGYAREQLAFTVSFRVPADSLVMLAGDDAREHGAAHRTAPPGIALVSAPGRPLTRVRGPYDVAEYAGYVDRIAAVAS